MVQESVCLMGRMSAALWNEREPSGTADFVPLASRQPARFPFLLSFIQEPNSFSAICREIYFGLSAQSSSAVVDLAETPAELGLFCPEKGDRLLAIWPLMYTAASLCRAYSFSASMRVALPHGSEDRSLPQGSPILETDTREWREKGGASTASQQEGGKYVITIYMCS